LAYWMQMAPKLSLEKHVESRSLTIDQDTQQMNEQSFDSQTEA